ncbi:hypothetical protein QBC40DRAFT_307310 [Triangularia verruculosa]|uniref:Uncharacterized protein n=1 Tax=Triangularia verruculosa TaxID=2587418 RepID=A0AAN6XFT9_9PEZI|nr:hypothetical protein QBC40DRAFT_307310 [Triangularia verruculosa]
MAGYYSNNKQSKSLEPYGYHSAATDPLSETEMEGDSDLEDLIESNGGYSPPAWRRLGDGGRSSGFWQPQTVIRSNHPSEYNKQYDLLGRSMREDSPDSVMDGFGGYGGGYGGQKGEDIHWLNDEILQEAIRTRLPGSMSPEKERSPELEDNYWKNHQIYGNNQQQQQEEKKRLGSIDETIKIKQEDLEEEEHQGRKMALSAIPEFPPAVQDRPVTTSPTPKPEDEIADNYIRFAVRAEVQHRTEPIDATINFFRRISHAIIRSKLSLFTSLLIAVVSLLFMRNLTHPSTPQPVPDLVKVASVARSLEPLIYYSENGAAQVTELQSTSIAVWDLSESIRTSNLTSAPLIVHSLDELADSLRVLSLELTKFFANVDGDIDGVLMTMAWARRELSTLSSTPPSSHILNNLLSLPVLNTVFGPSAPQITRVTLQRTFSELLTVLEEAVESELSHSLALFALFSSIDKQFLNLARTVTHESSSQEAQHNDLLSSLWVRLLGAKRNELAKFERNRELLRDVREKTVRNKGVLVEHNQKLLALKASLESLRRKLVSPLVRSVNSSTLTVEEQVRGLEEVGGYLEGVRRRQKGRVMEMLYGPGSSSRGNGGRRVEIGEV